MYPYRGDSDVPVNANLAFVFSEPMRSPYSITWLGGGYNLSLVWSEDRTTLFCLNQGDFNPNSTFGWILNPSTHQPGFRDLAGNPLASDISDSFQIGSATAAPDVELYIVYKGRSYEQTSGAAPVLSSEEPPYLFGAFAEGSTYVLMTKASVQPPGSSPLALSFYGDDFDYETNYPSQQQLDAQRPNGTYSFVLNTVNDGIRTPQLTLSGDAYPNAPRIGNFSAAQTVDPGSAFTLTWDAFAGGTTNDIIFVEIDEILPWWDRSVFETPDIGEPGMLNGTSTSCQIPAHVLPPGRTFKAELVFVKVVQSNLAGYPGALGAAAYIAITEFPMATAGSPIRPRLDVLPQVVNGQFRLRVTGEEELPYSIDYSDNLRDWYRLWTGNAHGGYFEYSDPVSAQLGRRFYRAIEGW